MITVFSNNCPRCKILEKKLKDEGVEFKVENNFSRVIAKGFRSAPVVEIGDVMYTYEEVMQSWEEIDNVIKSLNK